MASTRCLDCDVEFEFLVGRRPKRCLSCRPHAVDKSALRLVCVQCGEWFAASRNDAMRCVPCKHSHELKTGRASSTRTKYDFCACGNRKAKTADQCLKCKGLGQRGAANVFFKGGTTFHRDGYKMVLDPREGAPRRYILEHRFIWEQAHGPIPKGWVIHHLNGDKLDNRLENLASLSNSAHRSMHNDVDGKRSKYIQSLEVHIRQLEARIRDLEK
jgi:hypothetical protein